MNLGRCVHIKINDDDYGWGIILNISMMKKKEGILEEKIILDVMILVDKNGGKELDYTKDANMEVLSVIMSDI